MGLDSFSIESTLIPECFLVRFPTNVDDRGSFFRKYSCREFAQAGLNTEWVQTNVSSNTNAGTLRGFHFQRPPHSEIKLVTCVSGSVYDVALDVRPESPTYLRSFAVRLTGNINTSLYIPEGVAHAYLTLEDHSTVAYQVSSEYAPEYAAGVNYLDPKVKVAWPITPRIVSSADRLWPAL